MTPDEISDDAASRYVKAVGGEGLYMADTHEERMAIAKIEVAAAINAAGQGFSEVEIIGSVETEFGIVSQSPDRITVSSRRRGEDWPHNIIPAFGVNVIESGCTRYVIRSSQVSDNDDPITPEWLDTIYVKSGLCWLSPRTDVFNKPMLRILTPESIIMYSDQSDEWGSGIPVSFETRGQLRAWHVAHRQPLKEVQS